MIERPKFEDWCHDPSPDTWGSQKEAWDACMSAWEPIIAGLEAENKNLLETMAQLGKTIRRLENELSDLEGIDKVCNFAHEGIIKMQEDIDSLDKQLVEKNIEIARSVADTLKIFNYEGTSGGIARFTINGVPFSADVYDNSVGPLGAQRLDALHKVMANRAEAEGARKGETRKGDRS